MRVLILALAILVPADVQSQSAPTYTAVVAGMVCKQSGLQGQQLDCVYTVGRGLKFLIVGVGQEDVALTIERASGFSSDYYLSFGIKHGCAIVKPGKLAVDAALAVGVVPDMAFVSPKTGKVFNTWRECQRAG